MKKVRTRSKEILRQNRKVLLTQQGQVIIEYVLLLFISITFATLLIKGMVSRTEGEEGMVIKAWSKMIDALANDLPACPNQDNLSRPICPP